MEAVTNGRPPKRPGKCRCHCCKDYFTPDPRNKHHQRYCTKPQCRQASKKASQQRWLSSEKGAGYFSDPYHVSRVQKWRKEHPGYWKNTGSPRVEPLQDVLNLQDTENKGVASIGSQNALQDISFMQPALFIGLIASLTGSTLQDDIAKTTRRFIDSGRDILCNATQPISQ